MLASKEEVKNLAEKAVKMEPQNIRTLIFAADVLLDRSGSQYSIFTDRGREIFRTADETYCI